MTGFTKPTTLLRKAEVGIRNAVGAHVPADPRRGFTDHMEVLSSQLMIGYKKYPAAIGYPSDGSITCHARLEIGNPQPSLFCVVTEHLI